MSTFNGAWLDARTLARPRRLRDGGDTVMLDLPGACLRVRICGAGRTTVVIAPDPPNVIEHYAALIEKLAVSVRVVCYELPGFGFSRAANGFGFSVRENADVLVALLERIGEGPCALALPCGAGLMAVDVARRRRELVSHVAMVQTPAWSDEVKWVLRLDPRRVMSTPWVGQLVVRCMRSRIARGWYRVASGTLRSAEEFTRTADDAFDRGAAYALASASQALVATEIPATPRLSQPAVVIWGKRDRSHRKTDPRSALSYFDRAHLVEFDEAGHFPDLEFPDRFRDEILRLLDRSGAAPSD